EESQGQRHGLGQQGGDFHDHVQRQGPLAEGVQGQLAYEAAETLHLDAVIKDKDENAEGEAERDVHVSGGYGLEEEVVVTGNTLCHERDPVDRDEVHQVHQEDPAEYRQCQRGHEVGLAVEGRFNAGLHEFDEDFDDVLQLAGDAGVHAARNHTEEGEKYDAEQQGHAHGVDVDGPETHVLRFGFSVGKAPFTGVGVSFGVTTVSQEAEVVAYIVAAGFVDWRVSRLFCHRRIWPA